MYLNDKLTATILLKTNNYFYKVYFNKALILF